MNFFGNLSLGKKLYSGFAAVLVILIALSAITFTNFSKLHETTNWNTHTYEVIVELESMLKEMINMETGQRGFALTGVEESLKPFNTGKEEFEKHFNIVKELTADNPKQQELLSSLKSTQQEWLKIAEASISLRRNVLNGTNTMDDIIRDEQAARGKEIFDKFREIIAESESIERTLLDTRAEELEDLKTKTNMVIIIGTSLSVLIALAIAFFITRMITRPVNEIKMVAQNIAEGDLSVTIDNKYYKDEIGALAEAFEKMTENLNEVMTNINSSAEQVASGSRQVSDFSTSLSQGAAEQATSTEELSASIEEVSSQTKRNAENANQANSLAENAKLNASQGNEHMSRMLKAMDEINDSSASISKIIKVIDEIAFQTNILALNAAVEAARAGQHGKGFAVVAEEVRNLAQRSANVAKETTTMIEDSINKVEDGTKIAKETADALNEIVDNIAKVTELVNDIATASNNQATAISQINQGVIQISQVVQTTSATSEESAAASEQLAGQAEVLKEQVSKFKLRKTIRSASYKEANDINPGILKMLEDMIDKDKVAKKSTGEKSKELVSNSSKKIVLNENEFGKY
ncbi:methyl-accepting chemotaxis protein [Acetivibrio mesophilus]|uniref:HAMP domain-containing protein n=1 Tax=Acetivibrio mesophilus TaxID=2487273 RepID=A0A4Q0I3Y9_9FIRM|nr:methyl-accepting chemotaxis protein [Acetivibrio mesophilus]ODM27067.1 hypothetical protein A7W90_13075 [Clostridium sp. Bc-iso-3]RXE58487.1 HAMP domain-containing protein [Acetivibrio mesophilus]HHV28767.1 HAMP domain-containing protein [Clostridium sp.]